MASIDDRSAYPRRDLTYAFSQERDVEVALTTWMTMAEAYISFREAKGRLAAVRQDRRYGRAGAHNKKEDLYYILGREGSFRRMMTTPRDRLHQA